MVYQVNQLSQMLTCLLTKEVPEPMELEAFFLQALIWSVGAGLLEDGRIKFDGYVKYLASLTQVQEDKYASAGRPRLQRSFHDC